MDICALATTLIVKALLCVPPPSCEMIQDRQYCRPNQQAASCPTEIKEKWECVTPWGARYFVDGEPR